MFATEIAIESSTDGAWTVIAVKGSYDQDATPLLRDTIKSHFDAGRHQLVIDLNGGALDEDGLTMLVDGLKRSLEAHGDVRISCKSQTTLELLSETGLDGVFIVRPTVDEAIAAPAN